MDSIGGGNPKIWCGSAAKEMAHSQRSPQKNERIIKDPKRNGSVCWYQRPVSKNIQIHPKLTVHRFKPTLSHVSLCVWACVCVPLNTLMISVLSDCWLMGLICPTVQCVRQAQRPHWRT